MNSRDDDQWAQQAARRYVQTAAGGFPYIDTPPALRPASALEDSWWVIYAPWPYGGHVIEGYRIQELKDRQQTIATIWSVTGGVLWLPVGLPLILGAHWLAFGAAVCAWFAAGVVAIRILVRQAVRDRLWVPFPEALTRAIAKEQTASDQRTFEEKKKEPPMHLAATVMGAVCGGVVHLLGGGEAAKKISEKVVEETFKEFFRTWRKS